VASAGNLWDWNATVGKVLGRRNECNELIFVPLMQEHIIYSRAGSIVDITNHAGEKSYVLDEIVSLSITLIDIWRPFFQ